MFFAYFDESWDQTQQKILVIAGIMGLYHQWEKIEWRWRELLDKYNIAYYRANEAEGANGQFDKPVPCGWRIVVLLRCNNVTLS